LISTSRLLRLVELESNGRWTRGIRVIVYYRPRFFIYVHCAALPESEMSAFPLAPPSTPTDFSFETHSLMPPNAPTKEAHSKPSKKEKVTRKKNHIPRKARVWKKCPCGHRNHIRRKACMKCKKPRYLQGDKAHKSSETSVSSE